MGWPIAVADLPAPASDNSITVALIAALGMVAVALIGLAAQWVSRSKADPPAPHIDPKIGERVAVVETRRSEDRRTLAQLDRHVDGIGDQVEGIGDQVGKLRWDVDSLLAWKREQGG